MKRCVIVGGAPIHDYNLILSSITPDDFFIYCDSGLYHESKLYPANLVIGDFDSHERPVRDIETIILPREKDDTDTVFAVKTAMSRGFDIFTLVGVTGGRTDHTLCNIYALLMLHNNSESARIVTDNEIMQIVSDKPVSINKNCEYFSLIAIDGKAEGVTITGAKFPLDNAVITSEYQYGVSNEVTTDTAVVSVKNGKLLLIEIKKPFSRIKGDG